MDKELQKLGKQISKQVAHELFSKSQENLVSYGAIDTGFLLRSGYIRELKNGWEIVYEAPYSDYINDGTRPHYPPFNSIFKWVKRKLGYSDKKAYGIARAIQKKISLRGTDPKPFMSKAIADIKIKYKIK